MNEAPEISLTEDQRYWLNRVRACEASGKRITEYATDHAGFQINSTKYFSFLSRPLCGMSDLLPVMKWIPAAESVARGLVAFDEVCSSIPLIRSQSFDLFVAASKTGGSDVA